MKVFISQKMDGLTEVQILARRHDIIDLVKKMYPNEYIIPINSYIEQDPPKDSHPGIWYLARSIEYLSAADVAVFDKGYDECRGCTLEYEICRKYGGITMLYAADNRLVKMIFDAATV